LLCSTDNGPRDSGKPGVVAAQHHGGRAVRRAGFKAARRCAHARTGIGSGKPGIRFCRPSASSILVDYRGPGRGGPASSAGTENKIRAALHAAPRDNPGRSPATGTLRQAIRHWHVARGRTARTAPDRAKLVGTRTGGVVVSRAVRKWAVIGSPHGGPGRFVLADVLSLSARWWFAGRRAGTRSDPSDAGQGPFSAATEGRPTVSHPVLETGHLWGSKRRAGGVRPCT